MNPSILRRVGSPHTVILRGLTKSNSNCLTRAASSPCLLLAGIHQSTRWASSARSKKRSEPHNKPSPQRAGPILPSSQASPNSRDGPNLVYAQSIAEKTSPTTLYEAGTTRLFVASSYVAGFFNIFSAGINAYLNVFNLPAGSPVWAPYSFGVVSILMAMIGTRFWLTPAANILSVKVLPHKSGPKIETTATPSPRPNSSTKTPSANNTSASSSSEAQQQPPVRIEIRARRVVPFMGTKRLVVEPHDMTLSRRLYNPPPPPPPTHKPTTLAERMAEEQRLRAVRQYELDHIMTAPFRHAKGHMATIWYTIRRGLTGEAFAPLKVKGYAYKMDVSTAYLLDQGRAMDRICNVEQSPDDEGGRLQRALVKKLS